MKQKIFLTSAIAMGVIAPAFAEPERINTFPNAANDEFMLENKVYTNAATSTNMAGVYEDGATVDANALYDIIQYSVEAGLYFTGVDNNNDATTAACTAGSYCPGVTSTTYENEAFGDIGIQSCPTIGGTAFTSDAGSSALTNCYDEDSEMSSAELNPFTTAHLDTSVSGSGYINGVKYKSATTTARRYATTATTAGEWAALDESDLAITGLACENGYHYKAGTPNLTSLIGITEAGNDLGYKSPSGTGYNENEDKYGITQNGEFVVDYGSKGKIHGHAQCSTRAGSHPWLGTNGAYVLQSNGTTATLPDSSGQYCYCQLDSYTPEGGSATALSAPWVFNYNDDRASNCATRCASMCANDMHHDRPDYLAFRAAVFGAVPSSEAMCEANTITINWSNASDTDIATNNAGTATYGSDVRTPVKAETIKGKTFKGWKFSKPTTTQLPE